MSKRSFLLTVGLLVVPSAPILAAVPVPEVWGSTELLGFFTLALISFAMLMRLKVLKPRVKR
jgi:hypothetical protein